MFVQRGERVARDRTGDRRSTAATVAALVVLSCAPLLAAASALAAVAAVGVGPGPGPGLAEGASGRRGSEGIVISAVFADGFATGDADEAVQLWNVGDEAMSLAGWSLRDRTGAAVLPEADGAAGGPVLAAGAHVWLTRDAAAFARSFGHAPGFAWGDPALPDGGTVPAMGVPGSAPTLANSGDVLFVVDASGGVVDTAVYGDEDVGEAPVEGWTGPGVDAYRPGAIGGSNQILYRALETEGGQPTADTDGAADWASFAGDPVHGRRARFPGWDLEAVLAEPWRFEETARLEVAVAPDGLFDFLDRHLGSARVSVDLLAYTFEHPPLAERLAERARAGVRVRVLVDGAPAGGHDMTGRWSLNHLAEAGAAVHFMDDADGVRARYRSQHAKLALIDDRLALVGTENPTLGAAPVDGTAGRRGMWVATDAPGVVAWARRVIGRDIDPAAHVDLRPFQPRDPTRGASAPDFAPERMGGGPGNVPRWKDVLAVEGGFEFETITAPEGTRRPGRGVLGLLARAGPGAIVRVEQLREPLWWGYGESEGEIARNPRLVAYLEAARRGARVRVMLDGYFDDAEHPNSNAAAVAWLRERAAAEGLDLEARTANPTGRGLHAKTILVAAESGRWIHVGSINGTEVASTVNREAALTIRAAEAHDRLAAVFDDDFVRGFHPVWLPWVGGREQPAHRYASHLANSTLAPTMYFTPSSTNRATFVPE